jgi:ribose transport system substrate-binding protein
MNTAVDEFRATSRRDFLKKAGLALGAAAVLPAHGPLIRTSAKRWKIAVIPKALDNPVFATAHYGALQRAKELGNVDIKWTASSTSDVSQEAEVIRGLISSRVDAIALSANAPEPLVGPINDAVKAGIVVITWDSDVPKSKRRVFYGVDSFKMGQQLAKETITFMGTKGKVILVSGGPGATNLNARLAGAKDILKKYSGIQLLGPYFHHDDLVQAQELTNSLLTSHPDAGAILMVAGVPFFGKMSALPQVIKNHGKVKIITTDVLGPELPFVKQGLVQALVGQDYWGWGYQSTTICYDLLTNKSCKYPSLVPQAMPVVTRANVDAWIARWRQAATPAGAARAFKEAPIGCGM